MPSADGLGWPAGKPLAISLSVMLEGWAEDAPGIGPMGNPLKPGVADLHALSWAEFGPKVGALRLLLPATRGNPGTKVVRSPHRPYWGCRQAPSPSFVVVPPPNPLSDQTRLS